MENYIVVYDFATDFPLGDILVCLVPLVILFIGSKLLPIGIRGFAPTEEAYKRVSETKLSKTFALIFRGSLWLLFVIITGSTIYTYVHKCRKYHSSSLLTVKGEVSNFIPMLDDRRGEGSFDVNGVHFEYTTKSWNAAIHKGLPVRISYYVGDENNVVLKLETGR